MHGNGACRRFDSTYIYGHLAGFDIYMGCFCFISAEKDSVVLHGRVKLLNAFGRIRKTCENKQLERVCSAAAQASA